MPLAVHSQVSSEPKVEIDTTRLWKASHRSSGAGAERAMELDINHERISFNF
jgi:hypothetical protein